MYTFGRVLCHNHLQKFVIVVSLALLSTFIANASIAQNINDPAYFPDPNFLEAVREFMNPPPADPEDPFTPADAAAKTGAFDCSNRNISDITGIEYFTGIQEFDCSQNQIVNMDVSSNIALILLSCYSNQLTSLDLSSNIALEVIYCHWNLLTSLDFSNNPSLYYIECYSNQLTSLDVTSNTVLDFLWCEYNELTSLNLNNNTALTQLRCGYNKLVNLDVTKNTALFNWTFALFK